ncbi:MAG: hypothetical protein A2504_03030 [Bdellovibrionales bacterium RIFOXYD12_FULL_39_22]|nr:MAG: hypothetical protein A2385_05745 [Bdellovibrionales bacterium RIFOXYB1_FULL_39_21]OFZ42256.1 MAG: hypothetical protein A2485_15775 [Bdellovibrionales bacterium RIFOXYC12_FULL_39_17]OFZ46652.1 MAG: hypothetical protein A2404_03895 [Bdellovibrionales bacterium RIFOXYC1_FULL_39_130]OFZ76071.1 MAG: hypothetical protein A2560_03255 [Bdellovibrionales bacterium RIFOXYD1_FULL_39_84]OFZ93055.1 MAG: hypothetical protein A2504_03030 [Bdellovibrionales bacterium RIFOXYD12_FULL_39_22]HLE09949.1 MA
MKDLTVGSEMKSIFFFALPMLIGNIFQQLYSVVDSIIVGNFLGTSALAAVGVSFPIFFLLIALANGLTMGSSILVAKSYGAKDLVLVRKTADTAYIVLFLAAIIMSTLGLVISGWALKFMHTPIEVFEQAKIFLDIALGGLIFTFGFNGVAAILRGVGNSKTPLYFLVIGSLINIALVALFVLVFHWGVAGSSLASVIAQAISLAVGLIYLHQRNEHLRLRLSGIIFDWKIFKEMLKLGIPSGVQMMLVALGMLAINKLVNSYGTNTVAAFTIGNRIDMFSLLPAMNLSMAISVFVGQNIGAKKLERVKKGYLSTVGMSVLVSFFITFVIWLGGKHLLALFTDDVAVIQTGYQYLATISLFYWAFSIMFITSGVIRGAGDAMVPMIITVLSLWGVRVPMAHFLSAHYGENGIWWSSPVAWLVGMALSLLYFYSGRWKRAHTQALAEIDAITD